MTKTKRDQIRRFYRSGLTLEEVGERCEVSPSLARYHLKRLGVRLRPRSSRRPERWRLTKLRADQIPELIDSYNSGSSIAELANRYGLCDESVRGLLIRRGVKMRSRTWRACGPRSNNPTASPVNERFFHPPWSENSVYWLGFILADGHVARDGRVNIYQHVKDIAHLKCFREDIGATHPIVVREDRCCAEVRIGSKLMAARLHQLGCVQKKTLVHGLPTVPAKFYRHLIRGIFDGDGTIYKSRDIWEMAICGSPKCLRAIKAIVEHQVRIKMRFYIQRRKPYRPIGWVRVTGACSASKFGEWLYRDATVFLSRKRERFVELVADHERQFPSLAGQRFSRLVVRSRLITDWHMPSRQWICQCDCGKHIVVPANKLLSKNVQSCGCLRRDVVGANLITHGMTGTPIHCRWKAMMQRSRLASGATAVCEEWASSFVKFAEQVGAPPSERHWLIRPDPSRPYSLSNFAWEKRHFTRAKRPRS